MNEKSEYFFLKFSETSNLSLTWKNLESLLSDSKNLTKFTGNNENNLIIFNKFAKEAYNALKILHDHISSEKKRVMNSLNNKELSEKERDKEFALNIKDNPFKKLLFIAKKENLSIEKLKEIFRKPLDLIRYISTRGLYESPNYIK